MKKIFIFIMLAVAASILIQNCKGGSMLDKLADARRTTFKVEE